MGIKKNLGGILLDVGLINEDQLAKCLELQKTLNMRLGEILLKESMVTREQLAAVLEFQHGVPFIDLQVYPIDKSAPKVINETLARKHVAVPINFNAGRLVVVMEDPFDILARDDIRFSTGYDIDVVMCFRSDILKIIEQYYDNSSESVNSAFEQIENEADEEGLDSETEQVTRSPVVRIVNTIIEQAIKTRASDIHIEPFENSVSVRYRIDGDLKLQMQPPKSSFAAIATRIKIIGGMDIAEKRIPQDGRVETEINGKKVDLRINLLPTVFGEKIVIRILDRNSILMTKAQIGFSPRNVEIFEKIIKASEGIILLTGPTGSGKTTTLYAVLRELNEPRANIITAEDPVEYRVEGINQVQINTKAGLSFASALRAMLRQDPDVIMVGEIRDGETAAMAIKAAITGHVVLSTLHTNDTVSTVTRLIDMGIEPFMVSTAVVGIIAQRLVKRICLNCRVKVATTLADRELLKMPNLKAITKGQGCSNCNDTGYKGRIAIHEVLALNRELKAMILRNKPMDELKKAAVEFGMETLSESCRQLVLQGVTTVEEMIRVAYSVDE